MLFSTKIKLNEKEYIVKIGIKEIINLQDLNINPLIGLKTIENIVKTLVVGLNRNEDLFIKDNKKMNFEESYNYLLELIENDKYIKITDITKIVRRAISLGCNKRTKEEVEKEEKELLENTNNQKKN